MIWSISWKNVWRNKTRSLVVIIAMMLGIFGGIMAVGIMEGWIAQRLHDGIYNEISHVQIHHPDFLNNEELLLTIKNYDRVTAILDTMADVKAYSPRTKMYVMAQTDWASSGFLLKGIDPDKEKKVSELYTHIIEGEYFEGDNKMPSIVIGSKVAETLKLRNFIVTEDKIHTIDTNLIPETILEKIRKIEGKRFLIEKDFKRELNTILSDQEMKEYGNDLLRIFSSYRLRSRVAVTFQNRQGDLTSLTFRLRGVFKTSNTSFDAMTAFVERKVLNEAIGLELSEVHEIAIICSDNQKGVSVSKNLERLLPENNVMSWKEISPELALYTDYGKIFDYLYLVIFLFALTFGIINTMLMSVLERTKELGMLMAIGMNRKRVFSMIMLESVFLSLSGAVAGMIISGIIVSVLGYTGINFGMWAEGFEALGYSAIVYPSVTGDTFVIITILVIITGIIASIWPARKALKLNPSDALRTD